jgi:hypothetical protein
VNDIFIDEFHKNRYMKLIAVAGVNEYDLERQSLFYIVAGNEDLYLKKKAIYDFFENAILPDCLSSGKVDFCSSSRALIRLAYNLYNGYSDYYTNPLSILCNLDSKNLFIACQAILKRFQSTHGHLALACHGG